jgi:REP element-mobilizing transposase RayT
MLKLLYFSGVICYSGHMPRSARIDAPGVLHHIIGRGIERRDIFLGDADRDDFIARLGALAKSGAWDVYAWALMRNHFHLLCKTLEQSVSVSMHRLLTGYVVNFNKRHRRHGYLFQNRFKSIVCQEDRYLKELVRYIHLNPLRSGRIASLPALDRYPFSGHSAILGIVTRPWQATPHVLACFGRRAAARRAYREFLAAGIRLGRRPELVGGGLVRSAGGWSEVRALRHRGEAAGFDPRILGDGEFVRDTVQRSDERFKQNLRLCPKRPAIASVCREVCETFDVSPGELCAGGRRRPVVAAREALSWIAVRELGYSGADVARFLGVTNSCITRSVAAGRRPDIGDVMNRISPHLSSPL